MKANKEKLEKTVLGMIAGVIILIVFFTVILGPSISGIRSLGAQIKGERDKLEKAQADIKNLAKIKQDLKKMEEKAKKHEKEMPSAAPDWLFERLNSLAVETGINFDKIEPKDNLEQLGSYKLKGAYIELKTDYHRLGQFINKLENSSVFIKVLDLSIAGNKDDINRHIIKMTIGVYVPIPSQ